MIEMIKGVSFNNDQMLADVYDDFLTATDLAEYLVIKGCHLERLMKLLELQ